jgi:hypothetical protein
VVADSENKLSCMQTMSPPPVGHTVVLGCYRAVGVFKNLTFSLNSGRYWNGNRRVGIHLKVRALYSGSGRVADRMPHRTANMISNRR